MDDDTVVEKITETRTANDFNCLKVPVSVVIPVKNEESNLADCLKKLAQFNEIIVVDSSSTDRTPQIAENYGAKYINFEWNGRYPKKRNWVLMNHTLANDWVLFLDADEFVDDEFCEAITKAIYSNLHCGYWLNYSNYFLGRPLRYGVKQRKLALFRVKSGMYERIEEDGWSQLDMEIHEHPLVEGSVGEIAQQIDHNDYCGLGKFIERHRDYALWESERVKLLQSTYTKSRPILTMRQTFKYQNLTKWWYPWFYFIYAYIIKLGFLDGSSGFAYAFYKTWYFFTIRILVSEKR